MSKLPVLLLLTAALSSPLASYGQALNFSAGNENFQVSLSSVPAWGWGAEMPVMVVAPPPPPRHRHHPPVIFHAPMIPGYVEEVVEYAPVPVPAVVAYPRHRPPGRRTKAGVSFTVGGVPVGLLYEDYDEDDHYYAPPPPPRYKHHKHHKRDKHYYDRHGKPSKHHYYKKHHRRHHDDDDD